MSGVKCCEGCGVEGVPLRHSGRRLLCGGCWVECFPDCPWGSGGIFVGPGRRGETHGKPAGG